MSEIDYKEIAIKLWEIIDDIDTISDMAKENDKAFRTAVEEKVNQRFDLIQSDGYNLFIECDMITDCDGPLESSHVADATGTVSNPDGEPFDSVPYDSEKGSNIVGC